MSLCTIIYNSAGADTNGGTNVPTVPITDVTTSQTVTTNATTTITFSSSVDLTGVADDGSDVIWVNSTAANLRLFRIVTYNWTTDITDVNSVTVATAATTSQGGLSWGIGGKRKTIVDDFTLPDFEQGLAGWIFEFEGAGTVYSAVNGSNDANPFAMTAPGTVADGPLVIRAASGATPIIDWEDGQHLFDRSTSGADIDIIGMTIRNITSTSVGARMFEGNSFGALRITDCDLSCWGDIIQQGDGRLDVYNTDLHSTQGIAINGQATRTQMALYKCIIRGSTKGGVTVTGSIQQGGLVVQSCIFRDLGEDAIKIGGTVKHFVLSITNNVFEANTNAGVLITGTVDPDFGPMSVINNIFTNNTTYGIESDTDDISTDMLGVTILNNAFYNNTTAEVLNVANTGGVTLTADPYTAIGSDDYTLNATAGGGADCKDAGYGYNG